MNEAPFRADHVGSLLRPQALKEARAQFARGEIDAAALRAVEDEAIRNAVAMQEEAGLKTVTDGEFRRAFWHYDFIGALDGVEMVELGQGVPFTGPDGKTMHLPAVCPEVKARVKAPKAHPMLEHFTALASMAKVQPKISIPAPSVLHFRVSERGISEDLYPELEELFEDLIEAYSTIIQQFYDIGCRYIQLDEVYIVYLCDPKIRAQVEQRGLDPDWLMRAYGRMIDGAVKNRPEDMLAAMHLCRGNFRSSWVAEGSYERAADLLFNELEIDLYFMEYDSERAGGFEPLRFLPKGRKRVLPGLITTKSGKIENKDDIIRRLEEAAQFADMEQLGIAPQCGFASTEAGNLLSEDEQRAKLALCVEIAEEVWGGV